jgi:predicted O-methyltransferase YrrM
VPTPPGCENECAVIVTALRNYGLIVADNGASGGLIGTPDARWNDTALSMVRGVRLSDFEPVDVSGLIVDNDSGEAKSL